MDKSINLGDLLAGRGMKDLSIAEQTYWLRTALLAGIVFGMGTAIFIAQLLER